MNEPLMNVEYGNIASYVVIGIVVVALLGLLTRKRKRVGTGESSETADGGTRTSFFESWVGAPMNDCNQHWPELWPCTALWAFILGAGVSIVLLLWAHTPSVGGFDPFWAKYGWWVVILLVCWFVVNYGFCTKKDFKARRTICITIGAVGIVVASWYIYAGIPLGELASGRTHSVSAQSCGHSESVSMKLKPGTRQSFCFPGGTENTFTVPSGHEVVAKGPTGELPRMVLRNGVSFLFKPSSDVAAEIVVIMRRQE